MTTVVSLSRKKSSRSGQALSQLAILIVALSGFPANAVQFDTPTDLAKILEPLATRSKAPALAAAAWRDGKLIAVGVYGVRSIDSKEPVTLDDRFPIGSCSKAMARLVLARLVEKGVIDLDRPLSQLLEGMPIREEYHDVTLGDLVAHRAGIQPYTMISPTATPMIFDTSGAPRKQRTRFTSHVLSEKPAVTPRTKFLYSNAGFCILATIMEKASGRSWETLMAAEVFSPLQLESATEGGEEVRLDGHLNTPEGPRRARPFPPLPVMLPAGGVSLSITDFAAYAAAEADVEAGRPVAGLSAKTLKRLPELRPGDSVSGGRPGTVLLGGDGHFTACMALWPQQRTAIVVACNLGDCDDVCIETAGAVRAAVASDLEPGDTKQGAKSRRPQLIRETGGPRSGGPGYGYQMKVEDGKVEIVGVLPKSIAEKAGLQIGDIIVKVNGESPQSMDDEERMRQLMASSLKLVVLRDGTEHEIALKK